MTSIIPGYNYDIFISYRQKDNKGDKWVSEFVDNLKRELEATFKEDVSVYFDINPHDGLLETHLVGRSLEEKLKCLIFVPIISRTYCDPKSFAWQHEFCAFNKLTKEDQFGRDIRLASGNFTSRILPIKIHDLDPEDQTLLENELGGVLRCIEFIYKSSGVNRPLRAIEDHPQDNLNKTYYRDQINKVALAIKDIIGNMKMPVAPGPVKDKTIHINESDEKRESLIEEPARKMKIKPEIKVPVEKSEKTKIKAKKLLKVVPIIVIVAIILIMSLFSIKMLYNKKKREYARYELIPQIQKITEENFNTPFRAYELGIEAEKYIPEDSILISLWPQISENISLQTQPEGARVFWKDYNQPTAAWNEIGMTPFKNLRIPRDYKRIKIEKNEFQTVFITSFGYLGPGSAKFMKFDSIGELPDNMVRIPSQIAWMQIVGLETYGGKSVGEFLVDKFEVKNIEFKHFIDSGGYDKKNYWNYPIYLNGKEISWESAMKRFVDKTGRQGPANWEVGTYPEGEEDFPVAGISWYEASAYAAFAGKRLPNVYQWGIIAESGRSANIIPFSNYNGKSAVPVGSMEGMSSYGIYDLAGNVREWCINGTDVNGESYILGGGWNDPTYSFNDAGTQPSIDRSVSNGFRCIMELPGDTTINTLSGPALKKFRDYSKEKPVDDKTFNIFLRQYAYDKSPLNEQVITIADTGIWKLEKITMDAAYNDERLIVYLFIPLDVIPPYQPVIFFPGGNVILLNNFTSHLNYYKRHFDFIVKSNRVLVYPVLKGTFERKDELSSDAPEETVFYKDHVIMWRKDIGRAIDYLETRDDIISDRIGYFGFSWGGRLGGLFPAVERRIKAIVLHVGGLKMFKSFPEVDPINFLPRINQPVLMLNGQYDMYFPVETSQKPMFNLFGTPRENKDLKIYEAGHLVPRTELIKETLAWYDEYLGTVK